MIAECQHLNITALQQRFHNIRRNADAGGGVLSVYDDKVDLMFVAQSRNAVERGFAHPLTDDIADHKYTHRSVLFFPARLFDVIVVENVTVLGPSPGSSYFA